MFAEIHRLFFALRPPPSVAMEIAQAADAVKALKLIRGSWLAAPRYHVTIHFLGDYATLPPALVDDAKTVAAALKHAPFEFALDQAASFRGRRQSPCVMRCSADSEAALQSFWKALGDALIAAGLGKHLERRFTPHVTLAYGDKELPRAVPVAPILWPVQQFILIESLVGKTVHNTLGEWPLSA